MKITPFKKVGQSRTGTLENVTVDEINQILGFEPNCEDDPAKVKHSWGFKVTQVKGGISIPLPGGRLKIGQKKSVHCGIWDYKGSEQVNSFSTYGPADIFIKLFGGQHYR